jgi:PleD family two-component response regulator
VQDARATAIDWHGFHIALRRAALAATQSGAPLSLLMLEPAPAPGQPASDGPPLPHHIEALAGLVATELDDASALARYGEERLAVILRGVDLSTAISEAERIGRSIAPGDGDQPAAGAVIGVAQFRDDESLGHLIERVTDAVARARSAGQQVTVAEHRLRRRSWRAARGTEATLCPCGLYASPCACGLV